MVTIWPVSPATATVEPSGEATDALGEQVHVPLGQDLAVPTSSTRQCVDSPSPSYS